MIEDWKIYQNSVEGFLHLHEKREKSDCILLYLAVKSSLNIYWHELEKLTSFSESLRVSSFSIVLAFKEEVLNGLIFNDCNLLMLICFDKWKYWKMVNWNSSSSIMWLNGKISETQLTHNHDWIGEEVLQYTHTHIHQKLLLKFNTTKYICKKEIKF